MNPILTNIDSFSLWLMEHPSIKDKTWELKEACSFEKERHVESSDFVPSWEQKHTKCPLAIGKTVYTGGAGGGNCWNDDEPEAFTEHFTLPNITHILSDIMIYFYDNISFKEYRKHFADIWLNGRIVRYQYYGNYDTYESVYIMVDRLYAGLIELDIARTNA